MAKTVEEMRAELMPQLELLKAWAGYYVHGKSHDKGRLPDAIREDLAEARGELRRIERDIADLEGELRDTARSMGPASSPSEVAEMLRPYDARLADRVIERARENTTRANRDGR